MLRYEYGPTFKRVAPVRVSPLVGVSIVEVDDRDGVEVVSLKLDPYDPKPVKAITPKRAFVVYTIGDRDPSVSAQDFLKDQPHVGIADVPPRDAESGESRFVVEVHDVPGDGVTEYTGNVVLEYEVPDAA